MHHNRATIMATITALVATALVPHAASAANGRASWAPHLDRKILPVRVERHGEQLATWYGPGFYGNGMACGRTLTQETHGIAHRTLPCGTLVDLTYRGRRIAVRVVDRGPFSGATVDLTSRTKQYLGFTSGRVRMSTVKRYKMLPPPHFRLVPQLRLVSSTTGSGGGATGAS